MKSIFSTLALLLLLLLGACKSLFERGNEQFLSGQYQYAISTFNQVLATDSSNLSARRLLAESYRLSNRIESSLPHYQKLAQEDPSFETHFFLEDHYLQKYNANYCQLLCAKEQLQQLNQHLLTSLK